VPVGRKLSPQAANVDVFNSNAKREFRHLVQGVRTGFGVILIVLVFTNAFQYWAERSSAHINDPHSPYLVHFASLGVCLAIVLLDHAAMHRLISKPIFVWTLGVIGLFAWAMLVRTLEAPVGIDDYTFFRTFGLQINAFAFILACTMIFDDDRTLRLVTRLIAAATLLAIILNLYGAIRPGSFTSDVRGTVRSVGLYVNPNDAGMAVVVGCLLGISAVPRAWRETFVAGAAAAVLSTLSRESIFGMVVVLVGATVKRAISLRRLLLVMGAGGLLVFMINVGEALRENKDLALASSRLSFTLSDPSSTERLRLAADTLAKFEEAPLLGNGFGTSNYWTESNESHNLYLSFLADFGIFGVLIIPCLVVSIARRTWHFYTFAVTFSIWCFFQHNIFGQDFALIALAVEANRASRCDSFGLD
jgi:hypothetical protein